MQEEENHIKQKEHHVQRHGMVRKMGRGSVQLARRIQILWKKWALRI